MAAWKLLPFFVVLFQKGFGVEQEPYRVTGLLGQLDCWLPLGCINYRLKLFLLTIVMWVLWTSRKKRAIQGKFPLCPSDLLFKSNMFMQKWKVLLKDGGRGKPEKNRSRFLQRCINFVLCHSMYRPCRDFVRH